MAKALALLHVEREELKLEDLLRYGGARCVSSLAENRAWLHSMYLKLASVGDYDEVLMNLACRLLSCHGLLRMGAVALQAKLSIHPRNRASDLQPGLVTVSFSEFEELFLRCAFALWCELGHAVPAVTPMQFPEFDVYPISDSATGQTSVVGQYYKQQCAVSESLRSASGLGIATWGTDFVWPYASALLRGGVEQAQCGDMSDLCAFLGLERNIVESLFEWVGEDDGKEEWKNVKVVGNTASRGVAEKGNKEKTTRGAVESESLLASPEIKSRSGEILEGILRSRSSAPLSPQRRLSSRPFLMAVRTAKKEGAANVLIQDSSPTTIYKNEDILKAPNSPEVTKGSATRKEVTSSPTRSLLDGTKEALWPVYGTYCSCGDQPGSRQAEWP